MLQSFALRSELRNKYKKFYLVTQSACTLFTEYNDPEWGCDLIMDHLVEIMKLIKPDVTVISQRYGDSFKV